MNPLEVERMKVTVIGIGQTLRGDDAAGMEAVQRWQRIYTDTSTRPDVNIQYCELPGLGLLDLLDGFGAAVIVDAVAGAAPAGHVYRLSPDDLASFGTGAKSAHGWGIAETLELERKADPTRLQIPIRLVGIEGQEMGLGRPLSAAVEAALPAACEAIEAEVQALLSPGSGR